LKDLLINPILFSKTKTLPKRCQKMKFQIEKTSFVRHFQGVMKKYSNFFLTLNQPVTKKLKKN
jgi:hypothetical protein